mmetsp:Transcript_6541/g.10170  ORF Transcript_6541/g.10170 Transcript_6541/m.10170 type:complete len:108 (-) Transcript_6541:792-1115(-)
MNSCRHNPVQFLGHNYDKNYSLQKKTTDNVHTRVTDNPVELRESLAYNCKGSVFLLLAGSTCLGDSHQLAWDRRENRDSTPSLGWKLPQPCEQSQTAPKTAVSFFLN